MKFNQLRNLCLAFIVIGLFACQDSDFNAPVVPDEVITKIENMGFNPDGIVAVEEGYRIERDIIISHEMLKHAPTEHTVPGIEQYSTNNLVTTGGSRVITVFISAADNTGNSTINKARGGKPGGGGGGGGGGGTEFSTTYGAALNEAISRFNAENLEISFQRVYTSGADIDYKRLRKGDERQGILGSAGFPTASGDPYGTINMSGILESTYGLSVDGIATIMAHEMGHCIGFRHTDYFDRSLSCGGGPYNEGDAGIGANYIPGTASSSQAGTVNPNDNNYDGHTDYKCNDNDGCSWMLSCTDGSDRPFTNNDKTALGYLY